MTNDERTWETGWEGHELAQRRRLAQLTLMLINASKKTALKIGLFFRIFA